MLLLKRFLLLAAVFIILLCWPFYGWLAYEILDSPFNTIAVIAVICAELVIAACAQAALRRLKPTLKKNTYMVFTILFDGLLAGYFISLAVYFIL